MEQFGGYNGGILSRGILSGDFVLGGILSRGILSGGFCPGGFCPRTRRNLRLLSNGYLSKHFGKCIYQLLSELIDLIIR